MRRSCVLAALLAGALLLTACGGAAPSAGERDDGVLVYGTTLNAGVSGRLDPALSTRVCDVGVMAPVFGTLTERDGVTGEPRPGLAESWRIVSPTTLDLTLREGNRFHNGAPFDAAAVVAGFEHLLAARGQVGQGLGAVLAGVEALDEATVRIVLSRPFAGSLPLLLSGREGMIVAPGTGAVADTAPVGAGPFEFVSRVPGQQMVLRAAPTYWDAEGVGLDGVRFEHSEVGPATVNALIAGEIDMAEVFPADVAAIDTEPSLAVATAPGLSYFKLDLNLAAPPFDDVRVRQALNYSVNREQLIDAVFAGTGEPAGAVLPSTIGGFSPEAAARYPHDPQRARELLAEAGFEGVTFTAFIPPAPLFRRFSEVLQAQLAEGGIGIDYRQSTNVSQDYMINKLEPASLQSWAGRPDPLDALRLQFTPGAMVNVGEYSDPTMSDIVTSARAATDPATRDDLLRQGTRHAAEQALDVPLVFGPQLKAHQDTVAGDFRQFDQCQMVDFSTVRKVG